MPIVIELGLVGGHIGQAFLRGCLWAWFSLALTTRGITHGIRGIVAVEDAHAIFSMQSDTSTVFATSVVSLAQAVACTGVGTLLIDNRPDLLCGEVISEAGATIVTSIRNQSAQEKAAQLIGASPRERERMRHLSREEAIVLVPGTSPVLITVP